MDISLIVSIFDIIILFSDIDECKEGTYTCEDKSRTDCVNTDGGYECDCVDGFELVSWKLFGGKVNQLCRGENRHKMIIKQLLA